MKFWIILASVFLVLGIVGVGFAAEQSFTAEVTVNEYTSVTITPCSSTLDFGDVNPGTTDQPVSCQNDTSPAINVSVDPVGNKNINVETAGTDFTSGTDIIPVSNIEFDESNSKTSPQTLDTTYKTSTSGVSPGGEAGIWYWMDIDTNQPAGSYTGTIKVKTTAV